MFKKFNIKFKVKNEIIALTVLIILTSIFTIYHNQTKNRINNNYKKIIENFYFKKTVNHFFEKFEPRFKKVSHKVQEGETFISILDLYSLDKKEALIIKIVSAKISFLTFSFIFNFLNIENIELSIISLTIKKNQKKPQKPRLF